MDDACYIYCSSSCFHVTSGRRVAHPPPPSSHFKCFDQCYSLFLRTKTVSLSDTPQSNWSSLFLSQLLAVSTFLSSSRHSFLLTCSHFLAPLTSLTFFISNDLICSLLQSASCISFSLSLSLSLSLSFSLALFLSLFLSLPLFLSHLFTAHLCIYYILPSKLHLHAPTNVAKNVLLFDSLT